MRDMDRPRTLLHDSFIMHNFRWGVCVLALLSMGLSAVAQITYSDSFNTNANYLTNGIVGTIWDGVYFGAGEFNNSGLGGGGPGATVQCDANISTRSNLTLQTTGTAWEGADDDGFYLFKVVPGDFSMIVHVVSPYNTTGFNTAGLQARAFAPNGDPSGGSENFVSWTRFDDFNFANYLRTEINGSVGQFNPSNYPNANYWLRMDRVNGTNFLFYETSTKNGTWTNKTFGSSVNGFLPAINGNVLHRPDLAGKPLQVGIMHATFGGQIGVQFTDFSLTASNSSPVAAPSAPTSLLVVANSNATLNVSWNPGTGSAGSVVVVWPATNSLVKEIPANGVSYNGNSSWGAGDTLPGAGYFVVYSGAGANAVVGNLSVNTTYNVAVYSYAGSGTTLSYNHNPVVSSISIPPNPVVAELGVQSGVASVAFSANPGEWYWLQYSDSLTPPNWQNLLPDPIFAYSPAMSIDGVDTSSSPQRFYRLQQVDPEFKTKITTDSISSLQRTSDSQTTEYLSGGNLGNPNITYKPSTGTTWFSANTATLGGVASVTRSSVTNANGTQYISHYVLTSGLSGQLVLESVLTMGFDNIEWTLNLTNLTSQPATIGNLSLPLPMNDVFSGVTSSAMKHSFISGYDSFVFWMRPDSVPPYLLMTPDDNTKLEFWDVADGYEVYIHSFVAGTNAAAQNPSVTTHGAKWRQPNTSLTLAGGASQTYGLKFQWVNGYDGIRQTLVNNGKIDVHVVPGMTVPTNLFAQFALQTTQAVSSVTAEFPSQTQIQFLGTTNVNSTNTYQLYQVQFSQLGENELTVTYGNSRTMYLEFFVTEPLETLINKRAAYLVSHQIITNKWYSGLFCDENMNDAQLITPDNPDTLANSFQLYEIASDDAGESRPAYMATKEAVFPLQPEVTALDYYISNFVWGGLQRTTNESSSYGVYGITNWNQLRTNNVLSIGRGYDYPHIIDMYYEMYRVAKLHPEMTTYLSAQTYLTRAWGTAMAMWSYGGGQATQVGLMNEMVIPNLISALQAEGMTSQAASLRANWESKVAFYVGGNADLFASEYAFDSTGFESQEAYAKYALQNAGTSAAMGSGNVAAFLNETTNYMYTQITANVFDRGWLETAYYTYGSDYRGDMGDDYIVTYMSQMGGWGLLDFALNYATNSTDYLRLGYASYLNGWSTMNTGTPASNYGFWYPGAQYDGGCGGGFEPSPFNRTWLNGQPMHRGAWYYSAEENLGFCGAVREAATILADDPIFGRFCYGGTWTNVAGDPNITPLDGVRQRFHAMLNNGTLHLVLDVDHFAAGQVLDLAPDLSHVNFQVETGNAASHSTPLHFTTSMGGTYSLSNGSGTLLTTNVTAGQEIILSLPFPSGGVTQAFSITEQ